MRILSVARQRAGQHARLRLHGTMSIHGRAFGDEKQTRDRLRLASLLSCCCCCCFFGLDSTFRTAAAHILYTHSMSHHSSPKSPEAPRASSSSSKADRCDAYDANIRNFAPVARIMKNALPENAKIAKEAKECMQECVSEFISFITSEGTSKSRVIQSKEAVVADLSQPPKNASKKSARQSTARTSSSP